MEIESNIHRRKFLKMSAAGAAVAGSAAILMNFSKLFAASNSLANSAKMVPSDTKKIFWKCGTCSQAFLSILNGEFDCTKEAEGRASDPLAGGLIMGHQCGMLWGSSLAVGAESYRRYSDQSQATAKAIVATQHIMESFSKRTKSVNCWDIIGFDFSDKLSEAKFILNSLPGGLTNSVCMNLAEKWAPEAILSARKGLSDQKTDMPEQILSCASEVAKKMGAGKEESIMVAGFAGGMGLSGNACGALGSAIWLSSLAWCREHPGISGYANPNTKKIVKAFESATGSEFLCHKISGKCFKTIGEHTKFVKNGGCDKLINVLARS
jgi:hypothetical protein